MYYTKIGLTILLLIGAFSSLIYSLVFLIKFLTGRLSKREVINKTFWVTFCGFMSVFLAYSLWVAGWNIRSLIFFLVVSVSISLIGAFSFVASFWKWKE